MIFINNIKLKINKMMRSREKDKNLYLLKVKIIKICPFNKIHSKINLNLLNMG